MKSNVSTTKVQDFFRILLGFLLLFTGTSHLTFARTDFLAQVPDWVPLDNDLVVILSGIVELALGLSLIVLTKYKAWVGWVAAIFFIAIFPGNYAQYKNHVDAFGLNTDNLRFIRVFLHPLLIIWPLWSTAHGKLLLKKKEGL